MPQSRGPYKRDEIYQYTETVIYTADGTEVARWRNYDDALYDDSGPYALDEQEIADYIEEEEEEG